MRPNAVRIAAGALIIGSLLAGGCREEERESGGGGGVGQVGGGAPVGGITTPGPEGGAPTPITGDTGATRGGGFDGRPSPTPGGNTGGGS